MGGMPNGPYGTYSLGQVCSSAAIKIVGPHGSCSWQSAGAAQATCRPVGLAFAKSQIHFFAIISYN